MKGLTSKTLTLTLAVSAILLSLGGLVQASPYVQERWVASIISYQGNIYEKDTSFNGIGYFKFAVINEIGSISYWSNDGGSIAGSEPERAVPLMVTHGLFNVNLGDISGDYPNMTAPIGYATFSDYKTKLRVWFSPDNNTFTQMPDQKIAAVPYALQAQNAAEADYATNASQLNGLSASAYQLRVSGTCTAGQAVKQVNANGTVVCESNLQQRVTGTCLTGQAVMQVNADGSVVCENIPQSKRFSMDTVDSTGIVGKFSSIAIGEDGFGLISYYDETNDDLKVAHCNDTTCSDVTISAPVSLENGAMDTTITIGADGLGLIIYHDTFSGGLNVAKCHNADCSIATINFLTSSFSGYDASIVIGADALGLISYYDASGHNLMVAHCNNNYCDSPTTSILDSIGDVGEAPSIAIGWDGYGLISYYDGTNDDLKVAHCSNSDCSSATISILDSIGDVGGFSAIAIGTDGFGLISYNDFTNQSLKVAHCRNANCSNKTLSTLDVTTNGWNTSIAIGTDGLGLISYYDTTDGDLKVAHCSNTACSSATTSTLDSADDVGYYTAIAIGTDGLGLISYYDMTNKDLKVYHCSNNYCQPIY